MKLRVMVIEADDVNSADIQEVLHRAFPAMPPRSDTPPAPKRIAAPPASSDIPPVAKAKLPRKSRIPRLTGLSRHLQCGGCGYDAPPGLHHRAKCPRCQAIRWEVVAPLAPAHGAEGNGEAETFREG